MALLIGIDIGTQGTKAALYDQDGTLIAGAFEPSTPRREAGPTIRALPGRGSP